MKTFAMLKSMYISFSVGARNPPAYEARSEQLRHLYMMPSFEDVFFTSASE